jgi:hypothetical protein
MTGTNLISSKDHGIKNNMLLHRSFDTLKHSTHTQYTSHLGNL